MDGGIAPVPYASVYASSKAAISCLTEALAHQLIAAGTELRAAVFYPSGGLLDTGLWTAQRNRPADLARTQAPAAGTRHHVRGVQGAARGGGPARAEVMDLRELGRFCVAGRQAGATSSSATTSTRPAACCTRRADAIGRASCRRPR